MRRPGARKIEGPGKLVKRKREAQGALLQQRGLTIGWMRPAGFVKFLLCDLGQGPLEEEETMAKKKKVKYSKHIPAQEAPDKRRST